MSLASGIAFGVLLAYGASRTSANPKDFIFLLGRQFTVHAYPVFVVKKWVWFYVHVHCICIIVYVLHDTSIHALARLYTNTKVPQTQNIL